MTQFNQNVRNSLKLSRVSPFSLHIEDNCLLVHKLELFLASSLRSSSIFSNVVMNCALRGRLVGCHFGKLPRRVEAALPLTQKLPYWFHAWVDPGLHLSRIILNDCDVGVAYFLPVCTFWTYIMTFSQISWAHTTLTGTFSSHLCLQNFRGNTILPVISVKSSFLAGESTNSQHKDERTSSTSVSFRCQCTSLECIMNNM